MKITKEEAKELAACLRCSPVFRRMASMCLTAKNANICLKRKSFDAAAAIEELVEGISDMIAQAWMSS